MAPREIALVLNSRLEHGAHFIRFSLLRNKTEDGASESNTKPHVR